MKILLKDFQEARTEELALELELARAEIVHGRNQVVTLAAPTGSGKTVIATAVIERILEGEADRAPDPNAVVLWVTDQPELNEQTRRKMLSTSSLLAQHQLVLIDAALDQERLTPGRIYFLNTQKLGRNSNLVRKGDERTFTLWETITNTIHESSGDFYVVIDEAHRGMQEGRERDEANTIIKKFIIGSEEMPPAPLILGISATLARFDEFIAGTSRVRRPVEVSIDEVRESGLLKDLVYLYHPDESQPADVTMLREAVRAWKDYVDGWRTYTNFENEALVRPVMLVQVQDGTEQKISRTDMGEAYRALNQELGQPEADWFAHAFQEGVPIPIDGGTLRYIAPSAIDADENVRFVFFKTSLNTGWDCPRAEVMMSYRTASDDTVIAQLVGRMVRAPLARRIESDEHLNTVALYLPHYNREGLERVISRLKAGDPSLIPPTTMQDAREIARLTRAENTEGVFEVLERLPSYLIPKKSRDSQVKRLSKFAGLLSRYEIDEEVPDEVNAKLVGLLERAYEQCKGSDRFREIMKDSGVINVRSVAWRYDTENPTEEITQVEISDENVEDLFAWAGKRFGEGLNYAYWKARASKGAENHLLTKLEAYALAADDGVIENLENLARDTVQELFVIHDSGIAALPEGGRQAFDEIRQLAYEPEPRCLSYPYSVEWLKADKKWSNSLYVDESGQFPATLNHWETKVLEAEFVREDFTAWLRNPDRKPWSLCVPYEISGRVRGCYPDFLIIRTVGGNTVVDILDPHLLTFEDAWHRARGLAKYAAKHSDCFGRIILAELKGDSILRLDLVHEQTRDRVLGVSSNDHLRDLFEN